MALERPGLAKVGRGAPGASSAGAPRTAMGPAPRSTGTNPTEHHPQGRSVVETGGTPIRLLAAEPDRDGPLRSVSGRAGGAGVGPGLLCPGHVPKGGCLGGTLSGPARGRGRAGLARGRAPRGRRGLGEGPRAQTASFLRGGAAPALGMSRYPSLGGGGLCGPGVGPCHFMATRHGTISPTLRAGVHLVGVGGGGWGGGGVGGCSPSGGSRCAAWSSARRGR